MRSIIERLLSAKKAREIIKGVVMEALAERAAHKGRPQRRWKRDIESWTVIPDEGEEIPVHWTAAEYVNTTQAAALLGVTRISVAAMRDGGLLKVYRMTGRRMPLYRREEVLALKERRESLSGVPADTGA